jgi:hypothetical protein
VVCGEDCGSLSPGLFCESHPHPRLSENNLVTGFEADAARTTWYRERSSVTDHAGPVLAAIVVQPKTSGGRLVRNVRVTP